MENVQTQLRKLKFNGNVNAFRSPPVATQPSLGYYFSRVNRAWRNGYSSTQMSSWRSSTSTPSLSHVVVVSVVGGPRDYQVFKLVLLVEG